MIGTLVNPFANHLFVPTFAALGGLLAAGLGLVWAAERGRLEGLERGTLFRRWLAWLVIGPTYALAALGGEATMLLLVGVLALQGLREYAGLVGLSRATSTVLLVAGLLTTGAVVLGVGGEALTMLPVAGLLLLTVPPLAGQDTSGGVRQLALAALGLLYLPWTLAHLALIGCDFEGGVGILLALGLAVALSDVGAFTAGRLFGRRKLAPGISPNKTLGGLAGNVVGAYAGFWFMQVVLPAEGRLLLLATLPLVVAVGAGWGDLLESLMKREFGAKDTGAWLPGMGGLLDRVDSLIVAAPLAYAWLRLVS